jgi:hypothetical protein
LVLTISDQAIKTASIVPSFLVFPLILMHAATPLQLLNHQSVLPTPFSLHPQCYAYMSAEHGFRVPKSSLLWYWNIAFVMLEQCYRNARKILPFSKLSDFIQ